MNRVDAQKTLAGKEKDMETTVVNIKDRPDWKAEGGVYIGRGFRGQRASTFANPFHMGKDGSRGVVIQKYRDWLAIRLESHSGVAHEMESLRGKMLVCWCAPEACHGDVIKDFLGKKEVPDDEELGL